MSIEFAEGMDTGNAMALRRKTVFAAKVLSALSCIYACFEPARVSRLKVEQV